MTKVSLRAYDREIEGLIEHGQQLDEAVAHCRHILKTFPKHLDTYRLLGKAYLEAKRYDQAVDIFQRVLVAAPDDFVSHVGMSIIADDQGKLDEAIWHMERAFEVQPSNAAIQGELQRLFGRRDGVEPPKIRLTRGALAHMYVQGELYAQAISEIRAVLGGDPKRTDLQVLLAKAYFRNGQKAEAAGACNDLLSRLPYCLDANRLLAEILTGTQKAESAQEYRQRLNELDPYAAFAQESLFRTDAVSDNAVNLERLAYSGQPTQSRLPLGIGLESSPGGASPVPAEAGWGADSGVRSDQPQEPQPAPTDVPDFSLEAGWREVPAESQAPAVGGPDEAEFEPAAVPGDLPAWVKALAPREEPEPLGPAGDASAAPPDLSGGPGGSAPWAPAGLDAGAEASEVPNWLDRLGSRQIEEPSSAASVDQPPPTHTAQEVVSPEPPARPTADDRLDWLRGLDETIEGAGEVPAGAAGATGAGSLGKEPSLDLGALGTSPQEQDDALAWLEGLAAKHGAKPEEMVMPQESRTDSAPAWIDEARQIGEQAQDAWSAVGAPSDHSDAPARKDSKDAGFAVPPVSETGNEEASTVGQGPGKPFDWLRGLSDRNTFAGMETENVREEAPSREQPEPFDWQRSGQPPSVGDQPSWLDTSGAQGESTEAGVSAETSGEYVPEVNLPDWLAGLDKQPPRAALSPPEQELPAWLQTEAETPAEPTEGTRPGDWQPADKQVRPPTAELEAGAAPAAGRGAAASGAPLPTKQPIAQQGSERVPTPRRAEPVPALSRLAGPSLGSAQTELGRGNIAAALDLYGKLIRKGKSIEEIIRDLRDALFRYPVEVPIWQALGDAYMRANRLQEALDAYTKAEELLR
jgi:tetratricopeptide (TPR) repeat protein